MKEKSENVLGGLKVNKLILKMGLPMIISMILQALYNVVDSIFVANIKDIGGLANEALTYAFPIQIIIIAIGVGTGVGLNTLLSKSLGENDKEKVNYTTGNSIFISICIYIFFLIFGLFFSEKFITLFTSDENVINMGSSYLKICTCFSLGSIMYTVYERFLQSTGKTMLSTISQISGAITNIILDYIFIYPLNMGVEGAAWATVIGQFVSLFLAMYFHYTKNLDIDNNIMYLKPNKNIIKQIYNIGFSAIIMQSLLAVMMAGSNIILASSNVDSIILVGSFGIYYKIQQIALFSAFGLSNTVISVLSFNYGMKDKNRIDDSIKYSLIDIVIISLIISILFIVFASPLSKLFALSTSSSSEIVSVCTLALRISSIGFVFMGVSVVIQGILQSIGYAFRPLVISFLRLVVFVFPTMYLFTKSNKVTSIVWWSFPISEILTFIVSIFILRKSYKERIECINNAVNSNNIVISISREHGTNGKEIAKLVSKKLGISFYDKEEISRYAIEKGIVNISNKDEIYDNFLSLDVSKESIINESKVIKMISSEGDAVFVGRCADYILRDNPNIIRIFIYANVDYRINNIIKNYHDDYRSAKEYVLKSDKSRSNYYNLITGRIWGDKDNYDICIDSSIGNEKVVDLITNYIKNKLK